jgi:hypothetical protein
MNRMVWLKNRLELEADHASFAFLSASFINDESVWCLIVLDGNTWRLSQFKNSGDTRCVRGLRGRGLSAG